MVSLLELTGGGASLEFENEDMAAVRAAIAELFGGMRRRWFGLTADVTFGGERFTFQSEWDDPCLIASSDRGVEMLRAIAARCAA